MYQNIYSEESVYKVINQSKSKSFECDWMKSDINRETKAVPKRDNHNHDVPPNFVLVIQSNYKQRKFFLEFVISALISKDPNTCILL